MLNNYHPYDIRRRSQVQEATDRLLAVTGRMVLAGAGIMIFLATGRYLFF